MSLCNMLTMNLKISTTGNRNLYEIAHSSVGRHLHLKACSRPKACATSLWMNGQGSGRRNLSTAAVAQTEGGAAQLDDEELTVKRLMTTNVISLHLDDSMLNVAKTFLNSGISGAPVVDDDNKVVGILSEGDILWKAAGADDYYIIPPMYIAFADAYVCLRNEKALSEESEKVLATQAKEAMCHTPITATPDMLVSEAAALLLKKHLRMLPVVGSDGKLCGVITRSDILKGMVENSKPYLLT